MLYINCLKFASLVVLSLSVLSATPPPQFVNNYNSDTYVDGEGYRTTKIGGELHLSGDYWQTKIHTLGEHPAINLNGHNAYLYEIFVYGSRFMISGEGEVCLHPKYGSMIMYLEGGGKSVYINSRISGGGGGMSSFQIYNKSPLRSSVTIGGSSENTYTGRTIVSGKIDFILNKGNGAKAISGTNIRLERGAALYFSASDQINRNAHITLVNSSLVMGGRSNIQHIGSLWFVRGGNYVGDSIVSFDNTLGGAKYLYIDRLIHEYSLDEILDIEGWQEGLDFLLLRKSDSNLKGVGKIRINGKYKAMVKDYDKDYWQVGVFLPEPGTYGAIFGSLGLGIFIFRRTRRKSAANHGCGLEPTYTFHP